LSPNTAQTLSLAYTPYVSFSSVSYDPSCHDSAGHGTELSLVDGGIVRREQGWIHWHPNEFESGGGHRSGAKVGGTNRVGNFFLVVPLHFLALKVH